MHLIRMTVSVSVLRCIKLFKVSTLCNCLAKAGGEYLCHLFIILIIPFHSLCGLFCFFLFLNNYSTQSLNLRTYRHCIRRKYNSISCVPYFSSCFHGNMTGNERQSIGSEVSNCTNENAPRSTWSVLL